MLLEALVAAVCLQNAFYTQGGEGCPTALQAYYAGHTYLREAVRRQERKFRSYPYANETITYILIPGYTAVVGARVKISLYGPFTMIINTRQQAALVEYSIPF